MIGRPLIPAPPTIFPWASGTNYPPGTDPWSGQSQSVAPGGDFLTPGTHPPAENLNYIFKQHGVVDGNIAGYAGNQLAFSAEWANNGPAQNWYPEMKFADIAEAILGPGYTTDAGIAGLTWDPQFNVWVAVLSATEAGFGGTKQQLIMHTGLDGDPLKWQLMAAPPVLLAISGVVDIRGTFSLVADDLRPHVYYFTWPIVGSGFLVVMWNTLAHTLTDITPAGVAAAWAGTNVQTATAFCVQGVLQVGVTDIAAAGTLTAIYSTANQGGAWVSHTYPGQGGKWYFDVNNSGTGYPYVNAVVGTPPGAGPGQHPGGVSNTSGTFLAWSAISSFATGATGDAWGVTLGNDAGGSFSPDVGGNNGEAFYYLIRSSGSRLYQSTGSSNNLHLQHTFNGFTVIPNAIAAMGSLLIASTPISTTAWPSDNRTIFSTDGGISWYLTQASLQAGAIHTGDVVQLAKSAIGNGQQPSFVPFTQFAQWRSGSVRFSETAGLQSTAYPL